MQSVSDTPSPPENKPTTNTMKRDVFEHLPEFYKATATVLIKAGRLSIVD